jgi:type I restriction enzyme S subunit
MAFGQASKVATGTAQKTVPLAGLRRLWMPLPPLREQERIVFEIERLFSLATSAEDAGRSSITRVSRLRQSILKWAFEGKLADQDPSDEPALRLLERIRAKSPSGGGRARKRREART